MIHNKNAFNSTELTCRRELPGHVANMLRTSDWKALDNTPCELSIWSCSLDNFLLSMVQGKGRMFMRTGEMDCFANHTFLLLNLSGDNRSVGHDELLNFPPVGQISLGICPQSGGTASSGKFSYLTLFMPNHIFADIMPNRIPYGVGIDGNSGPGAVVSKTLFGIFEELRKSTKGDQFRAMLPAFCDMAISALSGVQDSSQELHGAPSKRILRAFDFVNRNYGNPALSPEYVANCIGISRRQLDREFSSAGYSFHSYLRDLRLNRAKQLLQRNNKIRMSEVAYDVGFSSQSVFCRLFKDRYGITPREFYRGCHGPLNKKSSPVPLIP